MTSKKMASLPPYVKKEERINFLEIYQRRDFVYTRRAKELGKGMNEQALI